MRDLAQLFYKGARGAIIVIDMMVADPLNSVRKWKEFLDYRIMMPDDSTIPCVLIANKERTGNRQHH